MELIRLGTVTGSPEKLTLVTKNPVYIADIIVNHENDIQRCYIKKIQLELIVQEYLIAELATKYNLSAATPAIVLWGDDLCFGSYDQDCPSLATSIDDINNNVNTTENEQRLNWFGDWNKIQLATAFDELISNPDRNRQNILVKGKHKVILIDHESAFSEDHDTPTNINQLLFALTTQIQAGDEVGKRRLLTNINKEIRTLTFNVIPDIINVLVRNNFASDLDKLRLENYLKIRLHNISMYIEMQLGLDQIGFDYSAKYTRS
jgi:hypothetical protein